MKLDGLPEGVECLRFGLPTAEDFVIENDPRTTDPPTIVKGGHAGQTTAVIVAPTADYEFHYDIRTLTFKPVKKMAEPMTITANARFTVTNEVDKGIVEDHLEALKKLPGYVE